MHRLAHSLFQQLPGNISVYQPVYQRNYTLHYAYIASRLVIDIYPSRFHLLTGSYQLLTERSHDIHHHGAQLYQPDTRP